MTRRFPAPSAFLRAVLLASFLVPSAARGQDTEVATSFLVDPSPRSSAMGGASGAIFWERTNASSLRVDNVEARSASGERIGPDWSGLDARLGLVARLAR